MNISKKILSILTVLALAISFTACSTPKNQESEKNKSQTKELREISVVLDWYPNAVHSFIYNAIEKGYYEEEGLKVNIVFPSNANDAISLVAAKKAEFGVYYPHDVIQAYANQGVPVKMVGSIVQSPLNIVLSLKDKNIHSPKDFEGKTIGYAGTELSEAMIKSMMRAENVDENSVKLVDVGFELMTSMTTNQVDATIGCLVNHEVPQMEEEGFKLDYFLVDKYGMPSFPELVFVTNEEMINQDKEVLTKFLNASKKGFNDMKNNPAESLQTLLNNQNEENFPLSKTVEEKSMKVLLPLMENENASFLYQNKEDIQNTIDWMKKEKIIDKDIKAEEVLVDLVN